MVLFVTWTRGLFARGHASALQFENRLQMLLDCDDADRALAAAASYGVLVNDESYAISAASDAVCSLLWQQVRNTRQLMLNTLRTPSKLLPNSVNMMFSDTSTPRWLPCFSCDPLACVCITCFAML